MKHAKKHSSKRVTKTSNNAKHINKAEKAKSQVKLSKKAQSKAKPQKVNTAKTAKVNTKSREDRVSLFNMIPKKALVFSMLLLLVFGFISATFAAFITSPEADSIVDGGLVSSIRTARAEKDKNIDSLASLGANADVAKTGAVAVYYVNTNNWSQVNCHNWGSSGTQWPGTAMTKTGQKYKNYDVYTCNLKSDSNNMVIFSNNGSSQTGNLSFNSSTPYYYNGTWLSSLEIPVYIAGTFNGWSTSSDKFTNNVVSLDLAANTSYQFKIFDDGTWKGNNGTIDNSISGWTFNTSEGNCKMNTQLAGTYTFTWDASTSKLSVAYPENTETIKSIGVNTDSFEYKDFVDNRATFHLESGNTYEFNLKGTNNTLYGNSGTMTRSNCTNWNFSAGTQNAHITADETGDYVFTLNNYSLSVQYPPKSGQHNIYWKGKVYFLAPEQWDLSTYSTVQVDITRTTSDTVSMHQEYLGTMTRLGQSRLYFMTVNSNHTNWNQYEFIAFTANDHAYGSGNFALNGNHYYTVPMDYGCTDAAKYYLFTPEDEETFRTAENYISMQVEENSNRDSNKKAQTVNIQTDGASSGDGGTVSMTGFYFTGDNSISSSSVTSTSESIDYNAIPGSIMQLEATPQSGYKFDGWYDGTTLISEDATYNYDVYLEKSLTAKFSTSNHTITVTPSSTAGTLKLYLNNDTTPFATIGGSTSTQTVTIRDGATLKIELTRGNTNQYIPSLKVDTATKASNLNGNFTKQTVLENITTDHTITFNVKNKPYIKFYKPDAVVAPYSFSYYVDGVNTSANISPSSSSNAYYCDYNTNVTITAKNATHYYVSDILMATTTSDFVSVFSDATRPDPGAQMPYTLSGIKANASIKSVQTPNPVAPTLTFSYGEAGSTYKQGGAPISPTYSYSPSYDGDKGVTSVTETFTCTPSTCTLDSASGTFSSDVPGTYTITYTVTVNVVNGEEVTSTKTATVIVNSAPKYTVTFTAQSRDGVEGYTNNDTLSENLSGGGTFIEGSNTTLVAPATATAQDKTWYFRGFKKVGGDMALGTKDGDNYKISVENITEEKTFYAYYSTAPNSVVPSYKTTIGNGEDFNINITNSTGGSGTYYFTYSFVPYGSSENYQRSNSGNITVSQPAEGRYVFKLRVHSDEVDNTTSMKESYTQLINQQDIYVLHSSEGFSASFEDAQGFLPGSGDGTTPETAYRVGAEHEVSITITPASGAQGTYYYKFGENDYSTDNHYVVPVATEGVGANSIVLKMYYIDSLGVQSAESELTIYYYIVSDFAIVKGDIQKVYTEGQLSSFEFRAKAGAESDAYTVQFAKSSDGDTYVDCGDPQTFDSELFSTFHVYEYLNEYGAAFFKATFYEGDSVVGDDYAHTYFGTQSKSGAKSIYFKNVSGTDIDTETLRLMACFSDENGNTSWVTMHKLEGKEIFRATVPNGYSSGVRFYLMYNSKYSRDYDASDTFCYAKSDNESLNANLDAGKYMYTMQSISGGEIIPPSEHWSVYSNI